MITTEQVSSKPIEPPATGKLGRGARFAYWLMLTGGIVLALTGVGTFITGKAPMSHWILMAHVGAAPLFAIGLALTAITWADASRFGVASTGQSVSGKALLWFILLCGLIVLLSGVVPMTPIFGTGGQHTLYLVHRYSAICLTVAVALHLLVLARRR